MGGRWVVVVGVVVGGGVSGGGGAVGVVAACTGVARGLQVRGDTWMRSEASRDSVAEVRSPSSSSEPS